MEQKELQRERSLLLWNIGFFLLIILYVVSFPHLINTIQNHMIDAPTEVVAIDFMGLSFWYLIPYFHEHRQFLKRLLWPCYLFASVNIYALF